MPPPMTAVADGAHRTAAQRGGEAKDKDRPLPDLQRDRCSPWALFGPLACLQTFGPCHSASPFSNLN